MKGFYYIRDHFFDDRYCFAGFIVNVLSRSNLLKRLIENEQLVIYSSDSTCGADINIMFKDKTIFHFSIISKEMDLFPKITYIDVDLFIDNLVTIVLTSISGKVK